MSEEAAATLQATAGHALLNCILVKSNNTAPDSTKKYSQDQTSSMNRLTRASRRGKRDKQVKQVDMVSTGIVVAFTGIDLLDEYINVSAIFQS